MDRPYLLLNLNVSCKLYCMMTPQRVVRICSRLGYSTTERKLTDWIQKGLIPHLNDKGRGRGRGKAYYWEPHKHVIVQILATEGLLKWYSRTKYVRLMLWFNGFDVDTKLVYQTWGSILEGRNQSLVTKYPDPFDLEEWIDRSILQNAKHGTVLEKGISEVLKLFSKVTLSNQFELSDELSNVARVLMLTDSWGSEDNCTSEFLVRGFLFLKKYFSPEAKLEILKSTQIEDLAQAQTDWATVLRSLELLFRAVQTKDHNVWPDLQGAQFWWQFISNVGGNAILLDLALRQEGFTTRLEQSVALLRNCDAWAALSHEIRSSVTLTRKGRVLFYKLFSELMLIWSSTNLV